MNDILQKEQLSELVWRYRIDAPRIARKRKAGQFIILRSDEKAERIPLTIANGNAEEGWIEIIFQIVGLGTHRLAQLKEGDTLQDLVGPLGKATHIQNFGRCLCIGGGVGVAPLYPIVTALREAGNDMTTIIGARNRDLLILEEEISAQSNHAYLTTDDGSYGQKGFVSAVAEQLISDGNHYDLAVVIGPAIMMKVTTGVTVGHGIKTYASLNPIMVDGTGMCGGCRVTVHGESKFACVDGPEFDAAGIDWDQLMNRLNSYREFEEKAIKDHDCKLGEVS